MELNKIIRQNNLENVEGLEIMTWDVYKNYSRAERIAWVEATIEKITEQLYGVNTTT